MDKFVMKLSDDCVYVEAGSVDELATVLKTCPINCVKFHLRSGLNDFSEWIGKSLGKKDLALKVRQIKLNDANPEETRRKLIDVLSAKPTEFFKTKKF
jgi:hypothetical protein